MDIDFFIVYDIIARPLERWMLMTSTILCILLFGERSPVHLKI